MMERRARSRNRGGVLVEFALAAVVLTPMLLGTFSFGLAFRNYSHLTNSVRNAARYASMQDYDSWSTTPSADYSTRVKNLVVYGSPDGGTNPLVTGLTPAHVNLSITMQRGVPHDVTVSITGYPLVDFFYPITLQSKPSTTFPYMGRFAPPL